MMEAEVGKVTHLGQGSKDYEQPPEAGNGKTDNPIESPEETQP